MFLRKEEWIAIFAAAAYHTLENFQSLEESSSGSDPSDPERNMKRAYKRRKTLSNQEAKIDMNSSSSAVTAYRNAAKKYKLLEQNQENLTSTSNMSSVRHALNATKNLQKP